MSKTAIFKHPLFLEHDPGHDHVESADRLRIIYQELENSADAFVYPDFEPATEDVLALIHTRAHIKRIKATAGKSFDMLDPDTRTSPRSWDAACLAAGAMVKGVDMLIDGSITNGFALVRPPGHHAEADRAMGFCLFNNIAIGAQHAIKNLGLERVFIIDWDLHHGNGTMHSFYDTDQVFYFSTHQYPYYPGSGAFPEYGQGKGEGYTLNIPLTGGQDDIDFAGIYNDVVLPVIEQYKPQLILVSAGYDIYFRDPLGGMGVTADGFGYMAATLMQAANEICQGKILFCLEGGYNLEGLRSGVRAVVNELTGASTIKIDKLQSFYQARMADNLRCQVQNIANGIWNL